MGGKIDLNIRYNEPKKLHPLKIASVAYAMKRQGEFPVIFLSFKDIKGNNYPHIKKIFKIAVAFCGKKAAVEYSILS